MTINNVVHNKIHIDVYEDSRYKGYETLYEQIEDDLGAIASLFLMRANKDPSFLNELSVDSSQYVFSGFTNKVEKKREVIEELISNDKPHIVVTIKDCLNLFLAHEERFQPVENAYFVTPRLYGGGKFVKEVVIELIKLNRMRSELRKNR
jgi:hypothetical protein